MGKKASREAAARILWAAEKMINDTAGLVPHDEGGAERARIYAVAEQVRELAGDVYWNRS